MKKLLAVLAALCCLAQPAFSQSAITLPLAAQTVADIGNGPIKVRMISGNASIFTAQGSGVGSTSGSSVNLTLTATPATAPIVGGLISGAGITSGTTVVAYNGTTGITLSAAMTVAASTPVAWGAACPASAAGIPSQSIQASVSADFYVLYTQARVCAVSPGGPVNTLLVMPVFYDQVSSTVSSVFGRSGAVIALNGDYNTSQVTEVTNLYYTNARGIGSTLTGYASGAGTISSSDTILQAIQKLNGNTAALVTGVSSVFGRTGAIVAATNDYNFNQIAGTVNLATQVAGTLPVARGGTGVGSFTANLPLIGNGTSAIGQGSRTGNTTQFATFTGTAVFGQSVSIDASGNLQASGLTPGSGNQLSFAQDFIDAGGGCTTFTAGTTTTLVLTNACYTASITATTLTVTAVSYGTIEVGQTVNGAGVTAGTTIIAFVSGTGGTGTYTVSASQTVASEAMTSVLPPTSKGLVFVAFDGVTQAYDTFSLATATLTFNLAIPPLTKVVDVRWYAATTTSGVVSLNGITGLPVNIVAGTGVSIATASPNVTITNTYAQHAVTFDISGSPYTWFVPAGVNRLIVDATGGGSGSGAVGYGATCLVTGNPGSNGVYVNNYEVAVTPGHELSITIGAGGIRGDHTGITTCSAANTAPQNGGPGGPTVIVDQTTGLTLLFVQGAAAVTPAPSSSTCSTLDCVAYYAYSAGLTGWAAGGGRATALGGYNINISHFPYGPSINCCGTYGATFFSGNCLSAEPGLMYGQGASSSISINSPAPGCSGERGNDGVAILRY